MLETMYKILGVNNMESAIEVANEIQRDFFLYGKASEHTENEFIASEFILDWILVQEEREFEEQSTIYEFN